MKIVKTIDKMKQMKVIIISYLILFLLGCKNKFTNTDSQEKDSTVSANIEKTQLFKSCNESFDEFFERFAKDSIFQKNRVKYPFKYLSSEYDFEKRKDTINTEFILNKDNFSFIDFTEDKNAMDKEFDKYTVDIEDLDSIKNYRLNGYDNGIRITHKFKIIDGCWYMVEILDEST